jgi:phage replication-related protein YjqB (UPF0714/DUF867 family)
MPTARRRTVLAALASAAIGAPALVAARSTAALAADRYPSNTALYADLSLTEGTQYARRYRRLGLLDNSSAPTANEGWTRKAVIAPHGGGIETGTSELCLAVAGYHPATLATAVDGFGLHDYWMFEGLLSSGNGDLHVTSTNCDDPYAESICGASRTLVSLHGCQESDAGVPTGTPAVLVGGLDTALRDRLRQNYAAIGITLAAGTDVDINGTDPRNICNRTLTGAGAQVELTTALRTAMFTDNTRANRKTSTTTTFWNFVTATRSALSAV